MSDLKAQFKKAMHKMDRSVEKAAKKIDKEVDKTVVSVVHACDNIKRSLFNEPETTTTTTTSSSSSDQRRLRQHSQNDQYLYQEQRAQQHMHHSRPQVVQQQRVVPVPVASQRVAQPRAEPTPPRAEVAPVPRAEPVVSAVGAPEEFVCPICCELMVRPKQCREGHSLCTFCWEDCLSQGIGGGRLVCPMDNTTPVRKEDLVPNRSLASLIETYIKRVQAKEEEKKRQRREHESQRSSQARPTRVSSVDTRRNVAIV